MFLRLPAVDRSSGRLLGLYAIGWLPYVAAYGAALAASMGVSTRWAAMGAVANVVPPALLGWGVVRASRAAVRRPLEGARLGCLHVVLAVLYASASTAGTWLLFRLFHRVEAGIWEWSLGDTRPLAWQLLIATMLYTVLAGLGGIWALGERLRAEEGRVARARELAARSQLAALRARLDPHFLFNTLHSVLALFRSDATAAEEAMERFGDLLRYALNTRGRAGEEVALAEEHAFVRDYLELEALRLGDRLVVEEALSPAALGCRLPSFTLQPLVENALRHGVAPRAAGGRVAIDGRVEGGRLVLTVEDDGPGVAAEAVALGGVGLSLVRDRLRAAYGEGAGLEVSTAPGSGFRARVWLPALEAVTCEP